MRTLDDTDREILRLLLADARRPYSDIADRVELSAPAVADRVERLEDLGVIRSFTVDVDRGKLRGGTPVLIELGVPAGDAADVVDTLSVHDRVEHVFRTAEGSVVAVATSPEGDIVGMLDGSVDLDTVEIESVRLLADREWTPGIGEVDLALSCDECGNTVTAEGVAAEVGDSRYHFCCGTCRANFEERYEQFRANA